MFKDRFKDYSLHKFQKDVIAGLLVGIIALPLGMGFAIASGTSPVSGIYTIIIAGFLISLLGGSQFQIGGPTGAFVPVLLGIVMQYGFENLTIATIMAGIMLIIFGLCRVGSLLAFIPRSVIIGFTAGIAIIIFAGQIPNFLGLHNLDKSANFLASMKEILANIPDISLYSMATAMICLTTIILITKISPKIPAALIGILVSTIFAILLFPNQVATIEDIYGAIPSQLPTFHIPEITVDKLIMLFPAAFAIALLGGIESLLSAVVADEMAGTKHNSKRELIAQGIANTITPFFGGIAATGAIARTAANIRSGAASPVSGIVHAIFVLSVLLLFAPYASQIPLASLAPVLMVVAWNMSEKKHFAELLKERKGDSLVLLATFLTTVLTDLTIGISVGLLLAFVLYMNKRKWKWKSKVSFDSSN